jgi:hypothetical protein
MARMAGLPNNHRVPYARLRVIQGVNVYTVMLLVCTGHSRAVKVYTHMICYALEMLQTNWRSKHLSNSQKVVGKKVTFFFIFGFFYHVEWMDRLFFLLHIHNFFSLLCG